MGYLYTYRLWGRLLYNPETEPETWQASPPPVRRRVAQETALSHASCILPLLTTAHDPSVMNNNYWPDSTSMPIAVPTAAIRRRLAESEALRDGQPVDPELFSRVDDFADELLRESERQLLAIGSRAGLEELSETAARYLAEQRVRDVDSRIPAAGRRC